MSPTPLRAKLTAIAAATVLLVTACGSSNERETAGDGIATLDGGSGDAATTDEPDAEAEPKDAPENAEDAFALFDECMAEHGFEFETTGSVSSVGSGSIEVDSIGGSDPDHGDPQQGLSIDDFDFEEFEAANEECGTHLENIDGGFDLTPEQEAAFEDAQLDWTRCMRDQGIDIPDFEGGSGGAIVIESGPVEVDGDPQDTPGFTDADFDFDAFDEAADACQYVYDEYDELDGLFGEGDQ